MRARPRRWLPALGVVGFILLSIAFLTWLLTMGSGDGSRDSASVTPPALPTSTPTVGQTTRPKPKPKPSPSPSAAAEPVTGGGSGGGSLPGLQGSGSNTSIKSHTVILRVTSPSAVLTQLGWYVPTSQHGTSGALKYTGTSWSHTAVAYGRPDYARLWVWSGPEGVPITCTIIVDGTVRDSRTTRGPYGAVLCQG